jgi:hypothetical protein
MERMMYGPGSLPVDEIIDLLAATPDDIDRAIAGLEEADLRRSPAGHEQCIRDICRSIRAEAEHGHRHLQRATGESDLPAEGNETPAEDATAEAIAAFKLVRAQTVALLAKLDPSAWSRAAVDPDWGNLTIELAALRLIAQEEEALDRIEAVRRALGK